METKEISNDEKSMKKLKPCCACPETKKLRDECIRNKGEEDCFNFVAEHNKCMKKHGFIVDEIKK